MENQKIAFIVHLRDASNQDRVIEIVQNFRTPESFKFKLIFASGKTSGEAFSKIHDDSYIKIWTTDSILQISDQIWSSIGFIEENFSEIRLIGFLGSEIPIDADFSKAQSIFGSYTFSDDGESATRDNFREPYMFQEVSAIDPSLIVTFGNEIEFDSKISDEFIGAAICLNLKSKGFKSVVIISPKDEPIAIFNQPSIYRRQTIESSRKKFFDRYYKKFLPLVSILIPSYNQPEFFKLALESALNQTYPNIEILVGDDSTDDRVQNLIKPYLKKHRNLFYDRHEKPLGFNGRGNMQKLLEDCHGEFIQYLYHDDLIKPEKISRMMQIFQGDLVGEIAFIASARNVIDANGNQVDEATFSPANDTIIESRFLTQTILETFSNSVGELTTILFRKNDLWKDSNGISRIGNFAGVQDDSMWDVSTFMEIGRKRSKIVYLSDSLSSMRLHADQNSQNPKVIVKLLLDFFGFTLAAFAYQIHIDTASKLKSIFGLWMNRQESIRGRIHIDWEKFFAEESDFEAATLKKIIESLESKKFREAIHFELAYLERKDEIESFMDSFCRNENGFWSLKNFAEE